MRIRVEDIVAFLMVSDLGSFNAAADELAITQSALSRRMKKLEDHLGAKLLDRTTRRVRLTTVGHEFLPRARRMVRDFERSLADIVDVIQIRAGLVTISSNMTIAETLLPEILERFTASHPEVRVRVLEASSPEAIERVAHGDVEFGIAQLGEPRPGLEFEPMLHDDYVLACHRGHPLARRRRLRWSHLEGESVIRMNPDSGTWRMVQRALDEHRVTVAGCLEVAHLSALLGLVGRNLGIAAIPRLGASRRPDLELVTRPIRDPTVVRVLGVATLPGRTLSPAADALRTVVRDVLAEAERARR